MVAMWQDKARESDNAIIFYVVVFVFVLGQERLSSTCSSASLNLVKDKDEDEEVESNHIVRFMRRDLSAPSGACGRVN